MKKNTQDITVTICLAREKGLAQVVRENGVITYNVFSSADDQALEQIKNIAIAIVEEITK